MQACGLPFRRAARPREPISAPFVELHIEQAAFWRATDGRLASSTPSSGNDRYTVTLNGESNHAGTTPMGYRRDTISCLQSYLQSVIEKPNSMASPVLTFTARIEPDRIRSMLSWKNHIYNRLPAYGRRGTSRIYRTVGKRPCAQSAMKWISHRYRFVDGRSAGADERAELVAASPGCVKPNN